MKEQYDSWLEVQVQDTTKVAAPSKQLICQWVKAAWDKMDLKMIQNSFKTCGLTNSLSGEEDSLMKALRDYPQSLAALQEAWKAVDRQIDGSDPFDVDSEDESYSISQPAIDGVDDDFEVDI